MLQQRFESRRSLRPGLWSLLGLAALVALGSFRAEAQRADSGAGEVPDWAGKPGYHWRGEVNGDPYVFLGDGATFISASDQDLARAGQALKEQRGLWFEFGGGTYLVRDAATLDQVQSIIKPRMEFTSRLEQPARQHASHKARETELMDRRAELLQLEAEVQARRSELTVAEDRRVRQGKLAGSRADQLAELDQQLREIDAQLSELIAQNEALHQDRMKVWKEEEGKSNERQRLAQSTDSKLRALMQNAVATGIAQRVAG